MSVIIIGSAEVKTNSTCQSLSTLRKQLMVVRPMQPCGRCKHRNTAIGTEIHHNASIYLPKYTHTKYTVVVEVHTHINSYVMFGYALFLINIGGTRAKYLSRL